MNSQSASRQRTILVAVLGGLFFLCICGVFATNALNGLFGQDQGTSTPAAPVNSGATITLAYSPEKAKLIRELVDRFNGEKRRVDRDTMRIETVELTSEEMVNQALTPFKRA